MTETSWKVFVCFIICCMWCVVLSSDDSEKKPPLKQSKKFNAIEGAVRLIGGDNSFEGEIV